MVSNIDLLSHLSKLMSLGKHEPQKLCLFSHAVIYRRISKTKWVGEK